MSHAPYTPDNNSPAADAGFALAVVMGGFLVIFVLGLQTLAGLPILWDVGGHDAGADHAAGGEH